MQKPNETRLFRANARHKWHYVAETVETRKQNVYIAPCGFESSESFALMETFKRDELPHHTCERCYRYLTGQSPRGEPVKLRLRPIKGATEGWRPDFMRKADE